MDLDETIYQTIFSCLELLFDNYTPDKRSMWGYIVFAFPFVRTFVRSFVRTFLRSFVRLSVTGSTFLR